MLPIFQTMDPAGKNLLRNIQTERKCWTCFNRSKIYLRLAPSGSFDIDTMEESETFEI